ncbi:hypothetical protein AB1Y20_017290 [Prymnesium parvum]|uniref:Exonuclease domain-containing protein n=1 Tax=Prymnesium parvum TaxID=97485 RepID=A0AB34JMN3_PRYPA
MVASSSNWAKLQLQLHASRPANPAPRKRPADTPHDPARKQPKPSLAAAAPSIGDAPVRLDEKLLTARLALDCEMVGVGFAKKNALARVVVVNFDEVVVYSCFVKPAQRITDFRTHVSGVRPEHMAHALPLKQVIAEVGRICRQRTLIGHGLSNDLKVLSLQHPRQLIRDTAAYEPLKKLVGEHLRSQRLKTLAWEELGWAIQTGEHNPCEDAVAALRLYKRHMHAWERAPLPQRAPPLHSGKGYSGGAKKKGTGRGSGRPQHPR